jgi:hypothetical protein
MRRASLILSLLFVVATPIAACGDTGDSKLSNGQDLPPGSKVDGGDVDATVGGQDDAGGTVQDSGSGGDPDTGAMGQMDSGSMQKDSGSGSVDSGHD